MKARALAALAAAAALSFTSSVTAAETFRVDPSHTSIVFSVSHLGYSFTYGMFREASGTVEIDRDKPEKSKFVFEIPVASVDTGNEARDKHLLAADFFDAEKHPKMTFESSKVAKSTDEEGQTVYSATGMLSIHGVEREVTLPLVLVGEGEGPRGDFRAGFLTRTSIKRSDFGMDGMVGPIGDSVAITISFEALRETAEEGEKPAE